MSSALLAEVQDRLLWAINAEVFEVGGDHGLFY